MRSLACLMVAGVFAVAACSASLTSGQDANDYDSGSGGTDGGGGTGGMDGRPNVGIPTDGGRTYPMTFVCLPDGGPDCPAGEPCPEVPPSSESCGDIGSILGHPPITVSPARPIGCRAGLTYGNPYYGDTQVECDCSMLFSDKAVWQCPI